MRHVRTLICFRAIVEFATVGQTKAGAIYHHLWDSDAITALLQEHDLAKKPDAEDTT